MNKWQVILLNIIAKAKSIL